jgi:hypothetical protein
VLACGAVDLDKRKLAEARRCCIHDHIVVDDGSYTRAEAGHAVEMTAPLSARTFDRNHITTLTLPQRPNAYAARLSAQTRPAMRRPRPRRYLAEVAARNDR